MENSISVEGLIKRFGQTTALDGLDLTVAQGEVHGFLGPNGAGKTTTIRILLGLQRADGGTVRLLGGDPWHDAVSLHRRLAYVWLILGEEFDEERAVQTLTRLWYQAIGGDMDGPDT